MQFQEELALFICIVVIYILYELQSKASVPLFNLEIHLNLSWRGTNWIHISRKISKNHTLPFIQIYPAGSLRGNFEDYQSRGCVNLEDIMRDEAKRRRSFYHIVIDNCPILLASAGFYGTGDGDETRCYSCGVRRRGWQRWEIPGRIDHKPHCKHRYGRDDRNIAIVEIPSPHQVEMYFRHLNINQRSLASIRSSLVSHRQVPVTRPTFSSLSAYLDQVRQESLPQDEEMCYEVRRFQSYNSVPVRASPMRLAQSGFYGTGSGDETRCYSCRMTYRDWRLMDQPDQIHRSMSPDCPHLNNTDRRNEPILSSASDSDVTTVHGVIGEYPEPNDSLETVAIQLEEISASNALDATPRNETSSSTLTGLEISRAVYPQYRDLSSRLDSYQGWGWSHVQDPQVLARAGFYYAGYRDCVRCFYCGVGLRTWERDDDPWVEHVRWRSSCEYAHVMRREQNALRTLQTTGQHQSSVPPSSETAEERTKEASQHAATDAKRFLKQQLEEENESLRHESTCKVCLDNPSCIVFLPCGHLVTCAECAPALCKCPICRAQIRGTVRIHHSS